MARPGKNVVGTPRKHRCRVTPTGRPPRPEEVQGECEGNRGGGEDGRASDTCLQLLQLPESPREPVQLQFLRSCSLTGTRDKVRQWQAARSSTQLSPWGQGTHPSGASWKLPSAIRAASLRGPSAPSAQPVFSTGRGFRGPGPPPPLGRDLRSRLQLQSPLQAAKSQVNPIVSHPPRCPVPPSPAFSKTGPPGMLCRESSWGCSPSQTVSREYKLAIQFQSLGL